MTVTRKRLPGPVMTRLKFEVLELMRAGKMATRTQAEWAAEFSDTLSWTISDGSVNTVVHALCDAFPDLGKPGDHTKRGHGGLNAAAVSELAELAERVEKLEARLACIEQGIEQGLALAS